MAVSVVRRLPGFAFEARAPVNEEVLPRMDVAVFAGFAASGPVNLPVPVEDVIQFATVFGPPAPLAWDPELGRTVTAQLAPAVRMFFANGGRRCWVIRLAHQDAVVNELPVPGVAAVRLEDEQTQPTLRRKISPLTLRARSPGSWSDRVTLSASLTTQRLALGVPVTGDRQLELLAPNRAALQVGDLLRLTWRDAGVQLYLGVQSVAIHNTGRAGSRSVRLRVEGGAAAWFDTSREPLSPDGSVQLRTGRVRAWLESPLDSPPEQDDRIAIGLDVGPGDAPRPGEVLVVDFEGEELILAVDEVAMGHQFDSPAGSGLVLRGHGLWTRSSPSGSFSPYAAPSVERLGLDLWARSADDKLLRVGELGLAPLHPRHIDSLPNDDVIYGTSEGAGVELWQDVVTPRFPAAGANESGLCIPLGTGALPTHYLPARIRSGTALERDGLAPFEGSWLADKAIAQSFSSTLLTDAEYLRFLAPHPRPQLEGIHAALPLDEATLIAVPDAAQPGWHRTDADQPEPDARPFITTARQSGASSIRIEWEFDEPGGLFLLEEARAADWHDATLAYRGSEHAVTLKSKPPGTYYYRVRGAGDQPTRWSHGRVMRVEAVFTGCRKTPAPGPVLEAVADDVNRSIRLDWTAEDEAGPFRVEEALSSDWVGTRNVYEGPEHACVLEDRAPDDYYYRVRGEGAQPTEWSVPAAVRLAERGGWRVRPPAKYSDDVLLAVHRMLLRICAARRDMMAVLSLPEHYREDAAAAHVRLLTSPDGPQVALHSALGLRGATVAPLGTGESDAFGFSALYHGWLYTRDETGAVSAIAPDGAACGMIARRANERGAWVAPANEVLRGVIALHRQIPASRWLELLDLKINIVRQHPHGFVVMSADTLATEEDVRPINVRRLLILLRRAAMRLGWTYVFEPNNDAFRRMVQRGFEVMLGDMFERGAFAGSTAAAAFQVVAGGPLNRQASLDQGRLIVELRVAPSRPMAFLTMRLVQTGNQLALTGA